MSCWSNSHKFKPQGKNLKKIITKKCRLKVKHKANKYEHLELNAALAFELDFKGALK